VKKNINTIYGVDISFSIEFAPTIAYKQSEANVVILEEMGNIPFSDKKYAPNVSRLFGWNVNNTGKMTLSKEWWNSSAKTPFTQIQFQELTAHEFGHIIGLGDAYLSSSIAPDDINLFNNSLMKYQWNDDEASYRITSNDIEMLLFAWQTNQMQLYDRNNLSNAFYR
jgi:hypothetical protein